MSIPAMNEQVLRDLLERVEALESEVYALQEILFNGPRLPQDWRLTPAEERLVLTLARRGFLSKDAAHRACSADHGADVLSHPKIVDRYLCTIRQKVAQCGIVVETIWGRGYQMPLESRRKVVEATIQ